MQGSGSGREGVKEVDKQGPKKKKKMLAAKKGAVY